MYWIVSFGQYIYSFFNTIIIALNNQQIHTPNAYKIISLPIEKHICSLDRHKVVFSLSETVKLVGLLLPSVYHFVQFFCYCCCHFCIDKVNFLVYFREQHHFRNEINLHFKYNCCYFFYAHARTNFNATQLCILLINEFFSLN